MPRRKETIAQVRANETRPASDEISFCHGFQ
jgi:hypothetical protein